VFRRGELIITRPPFAIAERFSSSASKSVRRRARAVSSEDNLVVSLASCY